MRNLTITIVEEIVVASKGKEMVTTNAVVTEETNAMVKAAVVATTKTQKNIRKIFITKHGRGEWQYA